MHVFVPPIYQKVRGLCVYTKTKFQGKTPLPLNKIIFPHCDDIVWKVIHEKPLKRSIKEIIFRMYVMMAPICGD